MPGSIRSSSIALRPTTERFCSCFWLMTADFSPVSIGIAISGVAETTTCSAVPATFNTMSLIIGRLPELNTIPVRSQPANPDISIFRE